MDANMTCRQRNLMTKWIVISKVDVGKQLVILKTNTYGTSILNLFSSIVYSKEDEP